MNDTTSSPSLKEKQRKERETLILQATEEILVEKGYHALSMDEIAARVGIAKGTLYLHFARKDDLVVHLLERNLHRIVQMIQDTTASKESPQAKLAHIQHALYQEIFGKRGQLLYALYHGTELPDGVKNKQKEAVRQIVDCISSLLEEGKALGAFDPLIPTEVMTSIFLSLLSPQAYRRLVTERHMDPEELIGYIGRAYFRGITTTPVP